MNFNTNINNQNINASSTITIRDIIVQNIGIPIKKIKVHKSTKLGDESNKVQYNEVKKLTLSNSFIKKKNVSPYWTRLTRWTDDEVKAFYQGIEKIDLDFSLIALLIKTKSKRQVALKYKYECKHHPLKIKEAHNNTYSNQNKQFYCNALNNIIEDANIDLFKGNVFLQSALVANGSNLLHNNDVAHYNNLLTTFHHINQNNLLTTGHHINQNNLLTTGHHINQNNLLTTGHHINQNNLLTTGHHINQNNLLTNEHHINQNNLLTNGHHINQNNLLTNGHYNNLNNLIRAITTSPVVSTVQIDHIGNINIDALLFNEHGKVIINHDFNTN